MNGDAAYRTLFRNAPAHGIALMDAAGVIVDWNTALTRLTGVEAPAAVTRDRRWLFGLLGIDEGETLDRALRGERAPSHGWSTRPDGRRWWCEATMSAIRENAEDLQGFALVVIDATDARRRELAHPESESRFARALEHAPVFVFNQDRDLRYIWAPAVMPGLGVCAAEQAIGRTDDELLPPEAAAALTMLKRRVIVENAGERTEIALRSQDEEFVFDLTVEPLLGPDGEVAGITCAAIDITARRRVEDELRHSRELLAEAEHLARLGSWEWDIARDEIQWSDGLYEIYGLTPDTFDARWAAREQRRQRVHPDDQERVEAAVAAALETASEIDMEYRIVRPDGRVRRVHGRAEVLVGDDGRPARLTGTAQDVTEIRAAEEALERTAAELGHRAAELHQVTRRGPGSRQDVAGLLTTRQLEILALIADGLSNGDIAARLYLSEATVKWHVRQILRILRVANRAEAAARYVRTTPMGG